MSRFRFLTVSRGVLLVAALGMTLSQRVIAQVEVARVQVIPDTVALRVGERALLSVQPRDVHGSVIPGLRTGWLSRDTTIAKVDGRGYVTAVAAGVAAVAALVGGREGRAVVIVRPSGPGARPRSRTGARAAAPR